LGDDTITAAASGTVSLEGGAGDDTIDISASSGDITSSDVIDGGVGTDTIIIDIADAVTAASLVVNFETITFSGSGTADASSFTAFTTIGFEGNTGSGATLSNVNGELVVLGADALVSLMGDNVTRVDDSVTVSFTASTVDIAATLSATSIETVDINFVGVDAGAASVTATFTVDISAASVVTIDVTGDSTATSAAALTLDLDIVATTLNLTLDSAVVFTTASTYAGDVLAIDVTGDSVDLGNFDANASTQVSIDISGNSFSSTDIDLILATDVTIDISGNSNTLVIGDMNVLENLLLTVSGDYNAVSIGDLSAATTAEIDLTGASFDGTISTLAAVTLFTLTGDGSISYLELNGAASADFTLDLSGFSGSLTGVIDLSGMSAYTAATITIGDVTGARDVSANYASTTTGAILLDGNSVIDSIAFTSASASGLFNISGFDAGAEDLLNLSALGVTAVNKLTITTENINDTLIVSKNGDFDFSIYLVGVAIGNITSADFTFA